MTKVRITPLDLERFTYGDCALLARTIHRRTGWPMATFIERGDRDRQPRVHAFVKVPNSRKYLDIEGLHSARELKERWKEYFESLESIHIVPVSLEHLERHWGRLNFEWYPHSRNRSYRVASHLISLAI